MKSQELSSLYIKTALFFAASKAIGSHTVRTFISKLNQAPQSYAETLESWQLAFPLMPFPDEKYWETAEKWIEKHASMGVHLIDFRSPAYPRCLHLIDNPPPVLFLRGNPNSLSLVPGVAIVGTRDASEAGKTIAYRIAAHLGNSGWMVVSGLALGIDRAAHEGALSVKASTMAVLAHGLHTATPKSNLILAEEILMSGGSWVSEHPLGVVPNKQEFIARNRIQIGLSSGSIIVEADINSGSMAQARFCVNSKRPLFAVVPEDRSNKLKLNCRGTLTMVNDMGAFPIKTRENYEEVEKRLQASKDQLSA